MRINTTARPQKARQTKQTPQAARPASAAPRAKQPQQAVCGEVASHRKSAKARLAEEIHRKRARQSSQGERHAAQEAQVPHFWMDVIRTVSLPALEGGFDVLCQRIHAEMPALMERQRTRDAIRANERTVKRLREIIEYTDDVRQTSVLLSALAVIARQTSELRRLAVAVAPC